MCAPLIEMHRVSIEKNGNTLLREVDLCIKQGEQVAILGPNGSGKSSLIRTMMGDLRHDTSIEGSYVRIRGEEHYALFDIRQAFGLVSGELQIDMRRNMTAEEAVLSGLFGSIGTNRSQNIDENMIKRAWDTLQSVGSEHLANRIVNTLSMGEARRVLMARALINRPEALILDEPMSALDLTGKYFVRKTMRSLASSGRSLILVTHDPSDIIPEINRVIMMRGGHIFSDGGLDTLTEDRLSELYDVPVKLLKAKGRLWAFS
ncbi:MAG: ATP-binding cassette domain-containing protein [Euryarchaeota archaeon]|nr:ATP-binding cassette domain-containing protein [Euryarchaeota archaeon]